jgi:hypothetical protein
MPPLFMLLGLTILTIVAVGVDAFGRRRGHVALRRLASERRMHFSPHDQLRITSRVATHLPIPGAAYVRVFDLVYGSEGGRHRYVFTAEYTAGVMRAKKRVRRAATFSEPRQRSESSSICSIQLGPADLSLIEQYRSLLDAKSES